MYILYVILGILHTLQRIKFTPHYEHRIAESLTKSHFCQNVFIEKVRVCQKYQHFSTHFALEILYNLGGFINLFRKNIKLKLQKIL